MKNYEVKYATKEFATVGTTSPSVTNKRLAYLVPNMFGKMKSGFAKKVSGIIAVYQEESVAQTPAPVIEVTPAPIEAPIPVAPQPIPETVANEKRFIIKAYLADINELKSNKLKTISAPKKLLISTNFKGNLFANYIKHKEVEIKEEVLQATSPEQKQQQAVLEYIALNDEMKSLIKKVEEIKAQMVNLAKENGLTRSMVEKAMQN